MAQSAVNLEVLSSRSGFNAAVRHIQKTLAIMDDLTPAANLADMLFRLGDEELTGEKTSIVLNMLLVDKLGYKAVSANLRSAAPNPSALASEFAKWKGVDLVAAYHHPELGLLAANPKSAEELAAFGALGKNELLVIFAGKGSSPAGEDCVRAAELALSLFEGARVKAPAALLRGNFTVKKTMVKAGEKKTPIAAKAKKKAGARPGLPAKETGLSARAAPPVVTAAAPPVAPSGPVKMTPRYAVVVQNELFHNGNVEAWKRIIASYNARYPDVKVFIYYEGERILDINSLFKWGKVKHGSAIEFAVAGSEIKDVAKLQRYLSQGASHQFEGFLRGSMSSVLKLF